MELLRRVVGWLGIRIGGIIPLVSLHLFSLCSPTNFSGEMEAAIAIRMVVPANGGAIVERSWIDNRGNPSSYRITTWVGQPPPGVQGPGQRQELCVTVMGDERAACAMR